ncbi:hypothetical protein BDV97DRAFT_163857 [Delphinella strobiligena]|nr:hypothetical protein BDV97DRAFT_163857 [Delphinella strobiligena]
MCDKDPKDHPEWKWAIMRQGKKRKLDMNVYSDYSDPDLFNISSTSRKPKRHRKSGWWSRQ